MKTNSPNTYPMQFRDKIDEYLWKEHHILGGCCSSIESVKYAVAREVAEKLTDVFIEKACEYWYQYNRDIVKRHGAKAVLGCGEFTVHVEDFRKYLEESKI